jgi:hypothetical protein
MRTLEMLAAALQRFAGKLAKALLESENVSRETFWYDWAKNLTSPETTATSSIM